MKSYNFRLTLLLILIVAVVHLTTAQEYCPPENCLPEEKCESTVKGGSCDNGNKCCSIVKSEYRTYCNHFYGTCMNACNDNLWVKEAIDCPKNKRCCILV
ncbi:hypothetical protein M0804_004740 [Polistes exclamans]|nr:hypothetical protein M0804_004740 [Polistes exclamans]